MRLGGLEDGAADTQRTLKELDSTMQSTRQEVAHPPPSLALQPYSAVAL